MLKALRIVRSDEGAQRRKAMMRNSVFLRERLAAAGLEVYGEPSAIVAVKMGTEALARLVSREIASMGLVANLVEFPAVPKGEARFRLQVMADHSEEELALAVEIMTQAVRAPTIGCRRSAIRSSGPSPDWRWGLKSGRVGAGDAGRHQRTGPGVGLPIAAGQRARVTARAATLRAWRRD